MNDLFILDRTRTSIHWTDEQKEFIVNSYLDDTLTIRDMCKLFSVRHETITKLLKSEGVEVVWHHVKDHPRLSNYFDVIDTADKAYWLGYLLTSAVLAKEDHIISVYAKTEDHLKHFRAALAAGKNKIVPIMTGHSHPHKIVSGYKFVVEDVTLYSRLIHYGCVPTSIATVPATVGYYHRKIDNVLRVPEDMPLEFIWHFLRGLYDGRGHLLYSGFRQRYVIEVYNCKDFFLNLREYFYKHQVQLPANKHMHDLTNTYMILGRDSILKYLNLMYKDSNANNREAQKYNKFIQLSNNPASVPLNP